jgi:hypothetical protein
MARPGPPDWARIDRNLCEAFHLSPAAIDAMTLPEIAVLCMDPKKGKGFGAGASDAEIDAYIAACRAMTPAQRIEQAEKEAGHGR